MSGLTVLFGVLPLLVIIGIVIAVVVSRGEDGRGGDDGHGTLRRVFVYSLALLGATLTASGLSGILRVVLDTFGGSTLVSETDRGLALGLALTIVGLPVWLLAWRAAQGDTAGSEAQRRSRARRLYLAAVRVISLSVAVPYAVRTGQWLAGTEAYGAEDVARMLVWGALWAYHEKVATEVPFGSDRTRRVDRVEVYLAATAGFAMLAGAVGDLLRRSLRAIYGTAVGVSRLVEAGGVGFGLRTAVVVAVVGAALWAWHWIGVARRDGGSTAWFVYLFLVGILSGTVTAVGAMSVLLHRVIAWLLDASDEAAGAYFDVVPAAVAALVVGVAVWGYHRSVLREATAGGPQERGWSAPERIYRYLVTAAGMLTAAGGIATVLVVGLDVLVAGRTVVEAPGGVRDVIAVGLTLLIVGLPLWWWSWSSIQAQVAEEPAERNELARRVLIFGAFGVAIVTTVVALSVLLYELFDAVLVGDLTADLIEEQRWSIALLLTAGAVSVHYGLVLREDRAHAPDRGARRPLREVIVVAPPATELPATLRERLEVDVTTWERRDVGEGDPPTLDVEQVVGALEPIAAPRALVIVEADGTFRAVPLGSGS